MTDHGNEEKPASCGSVSVWVRQLPAGRHEAQNELLTRYRNQLVSYAGYRLRQFGVRSKDAEDIAQDVFLELFKRTEAGTIKDLNDRDDLWIRLRQIARSRVIDARRKKLAFTESALGDAIGSAAPLEKAVSPADDLDECLLIVEHSLIRRRLAEQHPDLPQIATLKMQGYTVQQIADQMETAKRNVERRLQWIDSLCDEYAAE